MNLGQRVFAKRKELKLSQEELAAKAGLKSKSSISKIEAGRPTSQNTIYSLAQALDVSIAYLMGLEEKPEEKAAFEASVLLDEDVMEMVHWYMALDPEKREAVKQMAKLLHNSQQSSDGVTT